MVRVAEAALGRVPYEDPLGEADGFEHAGRNFADHGVGAAQGRVQVRILVDRDAIGAFAEFRSDPGALKGVRAQHDAQSPAGSTGFDLPCQVEVERELNTVAKDEDVLLRIRCVSELSQPGFAMRVGYGSRGQSTAGA